jgi:hypothetical protein
MKTYTAAEFEIEFYRAMHEWVASGKNGVDPRENWEFYNGVNEWSESGDGTPTFNSTGYRWKPVKKRTVVIDGVELVAPEAVAPKVGERYFLRHYHQLSELIWEHANIECGWLQDGLIFLTPEDAQAMYEAQRKQRLGGAA